MILVKNKSEIVKAVKKARKMKSGMDSQVRRLALRKVEDEYRVKVEKIIRGWENQWNKVAHKVGKVLHPRAQQMLASKGYLEFDTEDVIKSVYDIPPRYRVPIERAVTFTPQRSGLISATFLHLQEVYNRSAQGMAAGLGMDVAFRLRDVDVLKSLAERSNFLAGSVSETTFGRLKHQLATSYLFQSYPFFTFTKNSFIQQQFFTLIGHTSRGICHFKFRLRPYPFYRQFHTLRLR